MLRPLQLLASAENRISLIAFVGPDESADWRHIVLRYWGQTTIFRPDFPIFDFCRYWGLTPISDFRFDFVTPNSPAPMPPVPGHAGPRRGIRRAINIIEPP